MKHVSVDTFGGPEVLRLVEAPEPVPRAGQAIVEMEAVGVGYVDTMARRGDYTPVSRPGFTPGIELAGRIADVGEGVPKERIGRRVSAIIETGAYAERVAVDASRLVDLPEAVGAADAVALGVNALVAAFVLERARMAAGDTILVRGAGGGIGIMATQLAALAGATVAAVTSSSARAERLSALGATRVMDRSKGEAADSVRWDVIVDPVGGPDVPKMVQALATNGRYGLCGAAGGRPPADMLNAVMANFHTSPTLIFFSLNAIGVDARRAALEPLLALAAERRLAPVIDETFPLAEAQHAHRRLETGGVFGKLVLVPS